MDTRCFTHLWFIPGTNRPVFVCSRYQLKCPFHFSHLAMCYKFAL